jgi:TldD protein
MLPGVGRRTIRPVFMSRHVSDHERFDRRQILRAGGAAGAAIAVGAGVFDRATAAQQSRVDAPSSAPPLDEASERELGMLALDEAKRAGARYADVRLSFHRFESVTAREDRVTGLSSNESYGLGVRALVGGSWGFAGVPRPTRENVAAAAKRAAQIAAANDRRAREKIELAPVAKQRDASWTTPHRVDPFSIAPEEKADLLLQWNAAALRVKGVSFASSSIASVREGRLLLTSEGSIVRRTFVRLSPQLTLTAVSSDQSDFQSRTADMAPRSAGWEYVLDLDITNRARRWAEEAVEALAAPPVEPGRWDLVLDPSHLWLTIHESIGHPTELDRALGYEANYAGTSFLAPPEKVLGKLRLGPEILQIEANRTEAGGGATCGFDDEAVPAESWPLVKDGLFVDYQTTREQASAIAKLTGISRSHGCSYAQDWSRIPFQRMPNVSLLPGKEDLSAEDVVAAVDRGILIVGDGSYSIDQQRYNFQFGGQVFWEIRGGKKTRMLRDVAYVSRTPDFWNGLALLGGKSTYALGASFSDAKGQPVQLNAVSHGCPIALFKNVTVLHVG